jgi:hypothetical protein
MSYRFVKVRLVAAYVFFLYIKQYYLKNKCTHGVQFYNKCSNYDKCLDTVSVCQPVMRYKPEDSVSKSNCYSAVLRRNYK